MAQSIPETVPQPSTPNETNGISGRVIEVQLTWAVVLDVVPLSFIHDSRQYISKSTWLQWYSDAHKKPPAWMEAASYDWVKLRGIEGDTECLAAFVEVEWREQRKVSTVVPTDKDWEAMQNKQEQLEKQRAQQRAIRDAQTYAAYRQRQQQQQKKAGMRAVKELKQQQLCLYTSFKQQLKQLTQLPRMLCVVKRRCANTSMTQLLQFAAHQGAEKAAAQAAANPTGTPSGADLTNTSTSSAFNLIEHAPWPERAPVAAGGTTTGDAAAAAASATVAGGSASDASSCQQVNGAQPACQAGGSKSLSTTDDDDDEEGTASASAGCRDEDVYDSDNELECEGLTGRVNSMNLMLAALNSAG